MSLSSIQTGAWSLVFDLRVREPGGQRRTEEKVIDAQASVAREGVTKVVPEPVDSLVRVKGAQGVRPTLLSRGSSVGLRCVPDVPATEARSEAWPAPIWYGLNVSA